MPDIRLFLAATRKMLKKRSQVSQNKKGAALLIIMLLSLSNNLESVDLDYGSVA